MKIHIQTLAFGRRTFPTLLLTTLLSLFMTNVNAQQAISLYGGAIPGAKATPADYVERKVYARDSSTNVSLISKPELYVYQAKNPSGAAVIICPGGSYSGESYLQAGTLIAKAF